MGSKILLFFFSYLPNYLLDFLQDPLILEMENKSEERERGGREGFVNLTLAFPAVDYLLIGVLGILFYGTR